MFDRDEYETWFMRIQREYRDLRWRFGYYLEKWARRINGPPTLLYDLQRRRDFEANYREPVDRAVVLYAVPDRTPAEEEELKQCLIRLGLYPILSRTDDSYEAVVDVALDNQPTETVGVLIWEGDPEEFEVREYDIDDPDYERMQGTDEEEDP